MAKRGYFQENACWLKTERTDGTAGRSERMRHVCILFPNHERYKENYTVRKRRGMLQSFLKIPQTNLEE
jgi:hypothetical protein